MTKIDKVDIQNISLLKKEFKLQELTSVKIKKGNYEIELSSLSNNPSLPLLSSAHVKKKIDNSSEEDQKNKNNENIIKSPMVGVAYLSAEPSSPPYSKVGQHIKQGDTLLLIEAMKTFNEVKAPRSGIVKKIFILNNQPVEFGDDLIILE